MDITVRSTSPLVVEDRSWLGDVDGTQATRSITLYAPAFTKSTHYPNGVLKSGTVLARYTSGAHLGLYGPYAGQASEVQTATITGVPTGGTFTLTFGGETTAGIAFNATAAAIQAALEALPSLSAGDVTVTGSAGGPYTVTFGGRLAGQNVAAMTASGSGFTGGSTPGVTIATTTAGGGTAVDGLDVPRGFLFNSLEFIYADGSTPTGNIGAPMQERGFIKPARLPANSGLDANARTVLGNHFIFRD
jgi:hypothetical protein